MLCNFVTEYSGGLALQSPLEKAKFGVQSALIKKNSSSIMNHSKVRSSLGRVNLSELGTLEEHHTCSKSQGTLNL